MGRLSLFLVTVGVSLSLMACSTSSVASTVSSPGTDTASAAIPRAQNSTTATTGTTVQAALPTAGAGMQRFVVDPANSQARYRVREQLANVSFPNDAVGVTKDLQGQLVFDEHGAVVRDASKFIINLQTLKSNESRRDNFLRRSSIETDRFPKAEFVPTAVEGLPWPLPAAGDVTFQLVGDLTVHGATNPTVWQVTAKTDGTSVTGNAATSFKFSDFGMSTPRVAVVLSVEDTIKLEFDFKAALTQ